MVSLTPAGLRQGFDRLRARPRLLAAALAVVGGLLVYLVSVRVFPYHSINHDEGVYLQQAAMLLEGHLNLYPPVEDAFRPWFFVEAETTRPGAASRLYPKYAPLPAAMFALGKLLGSYRFALGAVAAGILYLTYAVGREAFDDRTGLLAAVLLLASPLFLVDAAVFLPYAPTTLLNLAFAFAYLRADRTAAPWWAATAGLAVGLAFFARPYTAVLFAAPFVVHALWRLRSLKVPVLLRKATIAAFGSLGVAGTLGYNALLTGSPWLFPYAAFAPEDGLGFGHREILAHDVVYDLDLALRSNELVLEALLTDWFVAGALGTALAALGLVAVVVVGLLRDDVTRESGYPVVLAGVFASVALGNVYFWGNYNILGDLAVAGDGLISVLGPYYHFDALVPLAAFAAWGIVRLFDLAGAGLGRTNLSDRQAGALVAAAVLLLAPVGGAVAIDHARDPIAENRAISGQLADAYEPFEGRERSDSLVFLPTPYGDWLNHPFQALRNDPGYDTGPVYALQENQFAVVDAFPDRTYHRYVYHNAWAPYAGPPVAARLQPVEHVRGERVVVESTIGIPDRAQAVSIRVAGDDGHAYYAVDSTRERATLRLVVEGDSARLRGDVVPVGGATLPVDDRDELDIVAFVDYGAGRGFSYRIDTPLLREDGEWRALTPYPEVCSDPRLCDGEAAYVPGIHDEGVALNVSVSAKDKA